MGAMPDLPEDAYKDCFHPPSIPTLVGCLHCGKEYDSYLIEWRESTDSDEKRRGYWCCPTPGCGGAGFGFDIFPLDSEYVDPDGRDLGQWVDDESVDEDWEEDDPDTVAAAEHDLSIINDMFDSDDADGDEKDPIDPERREVRDRRKREDR